MTKKILKEKNDQENIKGIRKKWSRNRYRDKKKIPRKSYGAKTKMTYKIFNIWIVEECMHE